MDDVIHNNVDQLKDSGSTLGREILHHPAKNLNLRRFGGIIFSVITILASLIIFLINLFRTIMMINEYGPAILMKQIPTLLIAVSIGLVIGLPILIRTLRGWQAGITIFENGMIFQKSNREHTWYWKEITRLDTEIKSVAFAGSDVSEKYLIILENDQHKELSINNNYESMDKMISQIRTSVLPLLYQHACHRFADQKRLTFHKNLAANQNGLIIDDQSIPYTDFNQPQISNRKLALGLKSGSQIFSFRLNQISNLDLLRHLISFPPN